MMNPMAIRCGVLTTRELCLSVCVVLSPTRQPRESPKRCTGCGVNKVIQAVCGYFCTGCVLTGGDCGSWRVRWVGGGCEASSQW